MADPSSNTPLLQDVRPGNGTSAGRSDNDLSSPSTGHRSSSLENGHADNHTKRVTSGQLSLFSAYAILVGSQIGAGIFSSPSEIDKNSPSPGAATIVWIVGGVIAWTGAASFAELGAAIPVNGGMQEYLGYIYNDFVASVMSWTWIVALKPSSVAILCIVFAEYWTTNIFATADKSVWVNKVLALATLGTMLLVNCISSASSTNLTTVLLFTKLFAMLLLIVLALLAITTNLSSDGQGPSTDWKSKSWFASRTVEHGGAIFDWGATSSWQLLGHYTTALYAALWGYSGWDHANFVAGELKNPGRDLPRAMNLALPTVIACFTLANLSYYIILPWNSIHTSDAIAVGAGKKVLGATGGIIFALLVSAACLGSLNINVYVTGRLTKAAAQHGYIPRFLAGSSDDSRSSSNREHEPREKTTISIFLTHVESLLGRVFDGSGYWNTPMRAMTFNAVLSAVYILVGNFGVLVTFVELCECGFFFLTVAGSIVLRFREPSLIRPYQPPAIIPTVFCSATGFLVIRGIIFAPEPGTVLISLIALGVFFQFYKKQKLKRMASTRSGEVASVMSDSQN